MTSDSESLWSAGLDILEILHGRGHEAYLVGGCVRDRQLGRPLRDIDIATSARPDEVAAAFARTIPTGLQHGTITVLQDGVPFEVTTFRKESGYSDARRPDRVDFVKDIREDLARRDFTVNAMAFGRNREWIDPFGGSLDLTARRIRCVGPAGERFGEDALRMIRAIRFAADFGFGITMSAWRGIREQGPRLRQVAMERVAAEWDKMMAGSDPDRACGLLERSGLLLHLKEPLPLLPEMRDKGGEGRRTRCLKDIEEPDVRWIALLSRSGASGATAAAFCRTLRFSSKRVNRIAAGAAFLVRMAAPVPDRRVFVSALLELGRGAVEDGGEACNGAATYREWLNQLPLDSVGQLAVKGDELARFLVKPAGPWVAGMLRRLAEETALGFLPNEKSRLLKRAASIEEHQHNRHGPTGGA
jgi:tRNA nucleotidyltransferase (CCA-adding enzyme)